MALGDAMVLQVDDARGCHLNGAKHGHDFHQSIVEAWHNETTILFVSAPEIGPTHKAIQQKKCQQKFFISTKATNLAMLRTTMP